MVVTQSGSQLAFKLGRLDMRQLISKVDCSLSNIKRHYAPVVGSALCHHSAFSPANVRHVEGRIRSPSTDWAEYAYEAQGLWIYDNLHSPKPPPDRIKQREKHKGVQH